LLTTSGITDFTLQDVLKPEAKRLRRNLSAVINFVKFHEDRQPGYIELTEHTDNLVQRKAALEEENERLVTEVNEANRLRQQEKPETEALTSDNEKREVVVRSLFNQQTELHNECQQLKAQLREVQDQISEAKFKLMEAKAERETLRAQVVPDPRKLKADLAALQSTGMSEKAQMRSLEVSLAQHAKQKEVLERAQRDIDEALGMQAEVEGEQAKVKEVQRQIKDSQEAGARDDGDRADQQHQIKGLTQRIAHYKERLERMNEQHAARQEVANQAMADAQKRWAAVEAERSQSSRQLDENESVLRELRDKLLKGRIEHETEVASVQQQQQLLAMQVRAYHQDMHAAMKAVSSSQQPLFVS
jgi:kinetochore protein Nuf2